MSLADARKGFQSKLVPSRAGKEPVATPPQQIFNVVQFDAPVGKLAAYLSPDPGDGAKHPAIIWITGGDCNSIGDVWSPAPVDNDQSARAFREAGIIMMFPTLRGGNENPGAREGFLGEVDDVLAATDYLAAQPYVDPSKIYLGGHSTGGTLVLLVAEISNRFRAVFSFGPADDVGGYGPEYTPFDTSNPKEIELRSPGRWLHSIQGPTYVFEGASQGNIPSLQAMARESKDPRIQFLPIPGGTHFSILAPVTRVVATKILTDDGPSTNIRFTEAELAQAMSR